MNDNVYLSEYKLGYLVISDEPGLPGGLTIDFIIILQHFQFLLVSVKNLVESIIIHPTVIVFFFFFMSTPHFSFVFLVFYFQVLFNSASSSFNALIMTSISSVIDWFVILNFLFLFPFISLIQLLLDFFPSLLISADLIE